MICSSGWDGRVICSTIDANFSQTFTANSGRITWLAGSPGHDFLVLASSTGGIWKLDDQIHELYSHNAIPYRVSVSPDGTFIASCGLDGSLIVFDLTKNRIAARLMAHVGAIHSIEWLHDELWTSGVDGALRQWRLAGGILELSTEIRETAPLRLTRIFTDGWVTNIHEDLLIKRSGTPAHLRLDFDKSIDSIDVSPDMRYIVAGVPGEVVIIDLHENRLASLNIDFASGSYIGFIDLHSLLISATTSLKTVQFEELDYVYF
jgi:WD40 repeat protein